MSRKIPCSHSAAARSAFSFLEVLLVLGIIGLMILCLVGFFFSRGGEPLKIPEPKAVPAKATHAPATPAPPAPPAPPAAPAP